MKAFALDPDEQPHLADFLTLLKDHGARFVVVGAWAVMSQTGKIRATKDIDVYVAPDEPNLLRVARVLGAFGFPAHLASVDALRAQPDAKFSGVTFGLPPNRIDVLSKMAVGFDELEGRIEEFELRLQTGLQTIPVASRADLVTLKRIAVADDPTRKSDRADLLALEALTMKRPARRKERTRTTRRR